MSNPYAFIGLPLGSQPSGSSNAGAMSLSHNIALGALHQFQGLMQSGGQAIPPLPFAMQPTAINLGLGGILSGPRLPAMSHSSEGTSRKNGPDIEIVSENGESERHKRFGNRDKPEGKGKDSRKRLRRSSLDGQSDDDIMVLSNSPSNPDSTNEHRSTGPPSLWENTSIPVGVNFSMSNPQVVGNPVYSTDPSFLPAMVQQIPFDLGMMPGVVNTLSQSVREPIHLKSCSLYPPNPQAPLPTTRERPLGCKTVFVGGLTEHVTEEILREIFERCGPILTIRMSKKNFAHVRFERECFVDNAIQLSGYRVKVNNQKLENGAASTSGGSGRLHVDFAQARDDQYEYECQARRLERELRHRQRIEEDKWRPPSPPPVPHYADHEAHTVVEQLKNEERFGRAVQVLATWLERGDCSKRNSNSFYSMIQSAHAHLRRLGAEKSQLEDEARKTHESLKQKFRHLISQLGEMERLFQAASHQKAWDHFTKAQRKSLESWKKHVMDLKSEPTAEILLSDSKGDDNMDLSDSDSEEPRQSKPNEKHILQLKEENDSLRCQLEAYKNEVEIVRADLKSELVSKEQKIKTLEESVNIMKGNQQATGDQSQQNSPERQRVDPSIKTISLLAIFLSIHRMGASLDDALGFVRKTDEACTREELDNILKNNGQLFSCREDLWRYKPFFD